MRTIWKFPIPAERQFSIEMPARAKILDVQLQKIELQTVCIWAEVNSEAEKEQRNFIVFATGEDMPGDGFMFGHDRLLHVKTFQIGGHLVFHLYERVRYK